ncbi:hypothetical protein V2O64_04765 [Verrucomicrobiaceae bacterium 227]
MKEPWSIRSRAKECAASGTAFVPGQKIRAAIFPDPDSSGYLRRDFSVEAWASREEEVPPFSTWITTYHPPVIEEKTEDVVDQDPETLLRRMVDEDEEHTENARYILAVMLERKKLLRETDTQQIPSGLLRVYEHRKTGDVFIIKDPQIPLSDVDRVQEEIRELLEPRPIEILEATEPEIEPEAQEAPRTEAPTGPEDETTSPEESESDESSSDEEKSTTEEEE